LGAQNMYNHRALGRGAGWVSVRCGRGYREGILEVAFVAREGPSSPGLEREKEDRIPEKGSGGRGSRFVLWFCGNNCLPRLKQ
jgi:hypothetical protein